MNELDYCPFCGADDVAIETGTHRHGTMAQVVCGHCCARGGNFVDEGAEEAKAQATADWNQKDLRRKQNKRVKK